MVTTNAQAVVRDSLTNGDDFYITEGPNTVTASYFSAADILKN
jgi:hypothetical protein